MSRNSKVCFALVDSVTGLYWCEGLRDHRRRGWHLLRTSATTYASRSECWRALRQMQIGAPMRARIKRQAISLAAPLFEAHP